jgi:uncharacterized protein
MTPGIVVRKTVPMRYTAAILISFLLFTGCAGRNVYSVLNRSLQAGDCRGAIALINGSREDYGSNAALLYLLDSAMVNMQCGTFSLAQERLHAAEALAEKLWTASISRNVAAMVTNDYVLPYAGEDYERVMIHLISAIGYLRMEQLDEALVEIRRLDSLLKIFEADYKEDDVYKTDAFGRYLSGMLHEADAAYDDAYIDYYRAAGNYLNQWRRYGTDLPDILAQDLLRVATAVNRLDDVKNVLPASTLARWEQFGSESSTGKVVLVVFSGEGPHKIQDMVTIPSPHGPLSIAFPRIVSGAVFCRGGNLQLVGKNGSLAGELVVVSDINRIALTSLNDRKGRIVAKAVARAVAKQVAIQTIASTGESSEQKQTMAIILNMANMLMLEKADTRSWRTLPGRIQAARVMVAPGEYKARLVLCRNQVFDLGTITVAPGGTRFRFVDTRYGGRQATKP